jgi:3-oxoacyl-[acyl-carrier-protein] synthase-3
MSTDIAVGVLGTGIFLPPQVRKNDWWPDSTVQHWRERSGAGVLSGSAPEEPGMATEGIRRVTQAMLAVRDDPFKGAVERRVMSQGMVTSDIQVAAGKEALSRAGIAPESVTLVLTNSQLPDHLNVPNAPIVHRKLGLPRDCLALDVDSACNSFQTQLALASGMIQAGRARYALLIQASGFLHLARPQDQHSAWFGDGATAVVIGPVGKGKGLLASCHRTDGTLHEALVTGCPGHRWFEGAAPTLYVKDHAAAREMLLKVADMGKEVVHAALADCGHPPEEVTFYASHQATAWFRRVTQDFIGLTHARHCDTFTWTGSLGPANIPAQLAMGEREGLLREGDLVAMYTGGSGITWSSLVMRWGL